MAGGHGFEAYGSVTKSEPANSVGARLMVQASPPDAAMSPGMSPSPAVSDPQSQPTGNPTSRPELMPGADSSLAVAVGQLLSRGGANGRNSPIMPAISTQDEMLLNAGFTPEELELYKQMGGVK